MLTLSWRSISELRHLSLAIITAADWTMFCHHFNSTWTFPPEGKTSRICATVTLQMHFMPVLTCHSDLQTTTSSVYFRCTNGNSNVTSHNPTGSQWSEDTITQLQGSLACTDWDIWWRLEEQGHRHYGLYQLLLKYHYTSQNNKEISQLQTMGHVWNKIEPGREA